MIMERRPWGYPNSCWRYGYDVASTTITTVLELKIYSGTSGAYGLKEDVYL